MVQALRNKFSGEEEVIKRDIRSFGSYKAAELRGQKATMAWDNYCKEVMEGEPFQLVTEVILKSDDELLKNLALEITNLLLRQALEIKELKTELINLKHESEMRAQSRKLETVRLMEAVKCRT